MSEVWVTRLITNNHGSTNRLVNQHHCLMKTCSTFDFQIAQKLVRHTFNFPGNDFGLHSGTM